MPPRATADLYRANQRRVAVLLALVRGDYLETGRVSPKLVAAVVAAQYGAAVDGAASVPAALAQIGYEVAPIAKVNPRGFAGVTADGRETATLLAYAERVVEETTGGRADRIVAGMRWLNTAIHSEVVDTSRAASSTAIAVRPKVGFVRMVNPPCCQQCAILAGRFYRWSDGFQRHKRCDCIHQPAHEEQPKAGYATSIPVSQIKDLTEAQRKAIDDGADLNRVVNAYRDAHPGQRTRMQTTAELGPVKGMKRLTPEGIYRIAGTREQAVKLLRANGYVL